MPEVIHQILRPGPLSVEWDDEPEYLITESGHSSDASYQPISPENYPSLSPVPLSELLTRREIRTQKREAKYMRPHKLRRRLGVAALCVATTFCGTYEAFMFDQNTLSDMVWGSDKATINTLWDRQENYYDPTTYIYVIPGTGIKDATPTIAKPIEPSFETLPNAKLMALKEGSHPQIEDTFAAIDHTIDMQSPPDRVILYGMSAGGKEALSIAVHVRQTLPHADISIILSSSPYDQDSAYELQGDHNTLPLIADLSDQLGLHGGPVTRLAVEMYNRRDQCVVDGQIDIPKCIKVAKQVTNNKLTDKATSNELFEWQVEWTRVNSAGSDIAALKNVEDGPHTSIMYINTTKDTIVDEDEAIPKFAADAKKNNIPFTIISLDDGHASEYQDPKNYNDKVIKKYLASIDNIYAAIDAKDRVAGTSTSADVASSGSIVLGGGSH